MTEHDSTSDLNWPATLGIVDIPSAQKRASEGRELILAAARNVTRAGDFTLMDMVLWGMVTRLQSFHEAAVSACEATNPHAAYTLIRAYAEQCAALIYAIDHPDKAERLWRDPDGHGVPIGKMTSYADRNDRIGNFRLLYDRLSKYAHPSQLAHYAGMRVEDDRERAMSWQSSPRFKSDDEVLIAYGWIYELAEAGAKLVVEFALIHGLRPRSDLSQRAHRTANE
ncbi:hypothetical protein [Aeromicrobium sp.]|uniref:hypothetical protein n=1 Tax=Aeromicrobium sp. TaxID=1871063 RepID=UPI0028ABE00B|nr:hypothetical protein [Aeromicrobium sp.]